MMMMNAAERSACIGRLRELPGKLRAQVEGLDERQLHTHFLEGEWTVAQNVHHIADAHMHAFLRVKLGLTEDAPQVTFYNQDLFAETPEVRDQPVAGALALIESLHARWALLCESLGEADRGRTVIAPNGRADTLDDYLRLYSRHGYSHIEQISRTLAAQE